MFKKPDKANLAGRRLEKPWLSLPALVFAGGLVATNVALAQRQPSAALRQTTNVRFENGRRAAVIPFDFDDGAIVIQVRVNNSQPLKFFFDTGAGMSVVSAAQAANLQLRAAGKLNVTGTGGTVGGTIAAGLSLGVKGVTVLNQSVAVLSLDDFPCEARDIAGIIGYDFIKKFVVEIDYEAKVLRLVDPENFHYEGNGVLLPLTIIRTPRVRAGIKPPGRAVIEGSFEIDTGHEGTMVINSPFVNRHKLLESLGHGIPTTGRGIGGISRRTSARLENVQLGSYIVPSTVAGLSLATAGALSATDNDGVIGNEVLQRFTVTLDYSSKRMWLEPNTHLTDAFASDTSGLEIESGGDNCRVFKVTTVADKSPAAEAGIQPGDELVAIHNVPAPQFTLAQIYQLLTIEGAERSLKLKRANQSLTIRIKLRRLF